MTYETFTEFNQTSPQGFLLYAQSLWVGTIPLFLFGLFIVTTLGVFFSSLRLKGEGDFLASVTVGSWFTTVIAVILTLITGLMDIYTLGVCFTVTILSTLLFIALSRD